MSIGKKNVKNNMDTGHETLLSENIPFVVQEAYKTLRTNVMFSLPGSGCKCVGITSPTPGEGKSTTASNLAISLAQINKRVLLIDCDMRIPTVAAKFQIPSVPGLSDFLIGEAKIDDAVRKVEEYGVHVLPAGNIPPDSTGLLEAKQLEHLFTAVRQIYDYVIVDLPPVITVPDAVILSKYVDGYLLTIWEKQTKHRTVIETLKQLKLADANIIGFVTTGGSAQGSRYYRRK